MAADGGRLSLHLDKPGAGPERHVEPTTAALAEASIACIDLAEESRPLLARAKAAGCTVVCDLHDYDGRTPSTTTGSPPATCCSSTTTG